MIELFNDTKIPVETFKWQVETHDEVQIAQFNLQLDNYILKRAETLADDSQLSTHFDERCHGCVDLLPMIKFHILSVDSWKDISYLYWFKFLV